MSRPLAALELFCSGGYHSHMLLSARRALFTILILLTAFRGAVGDAMAYGMTGQLMNVPATINSIASRADSMQASAHFEHQKAVSMPCHEAADITDTAVHACSTCQVCHLSITLPFSMVSHSPSVHHADKPSLSVSAWVSADLELLSKPPLS